MFEALGLRDRLINGTVYAEEIYMPREGGCQDVGFNIWEILTMREKFLKIIEQKDYSQKIDVILKSVDRSKLREPMQVQLDKSKEPKVFDINSKAQKVIIVIQRSSNYDFTRNQDHARRWNDSVSDSLSLSLTHTHMLVGGMTR